MTPTAESRINKIFMGFIIMMFIAMIYVGYLVILPIDVLTANNVRISSKTVRAGDSISYIVDYCKKTSHPATVEIYLHNEKIVALPIVNSSRPEGCRKNAARSVLIPKDTEPGTHHLEVDITYRFNPLNSKTYHLVTPNFEVTE